MPRVGEYRGVTFYIYYREHLPPHVHAKYGGSEATYDIRTGRVLRPGLPSTQDKLASQWVSKHRSELLAKWEEATGLGPTNRKGWLS